MKQRQDKWASLEAVSALAENTLHFRAGRAEAGRLGVEGFGNLFRRKCARADTHDREGERSGLLSAGIFVEELYLPVGARLCGKQNREAWSSAEDKRARALFDAVIIDAGSLAVIRVDQIV